MKTLLKTLMLAAMVGVPATAALAHHSHAMFDDTKVRTFEGTVRAYSFSNPHVYLFVDVQNPDGSVTTNPIEMSFAQNMVDQGMNQDTFKKGDKVTAQVNPFRDGKPGGFYVSLVDAKGMKHQMTHAQHVQ